MVCEEHKLEAQALILVLGGVVQIAHLAIHSGPFPLRQIRRFRIHHCFGKALASSATVNLFTIVQTEKFRHFCIRS
jgi:hypothetical protein